MSGLSNFLWFFGYAIAGAIAMGLSLAIFVTLWARITPIDEWEELRKGNMAVAVVLAASIIAFGLVIASAVHP